MVGKLSVGISVVIVIEQIILFALVLFVLFSGYDIIELAYVYIFAGIVAVTLSFSIVLIKIVKPKPNAIECYHILTKTSMIYPYSPTIFIGYLYSDKVHVTYYVSMKTLKVEGAWK